MSSDHFLHDCENEMRRANEESHQGFQESMALMCGLSVIRGFAGLY